VRFEAPLPDVPTLIVAGTADLRTPLEDALQVARLLPRAQLVPVRGIGHGAMFQGLPCVDRALSRFLAGRTAGRCPQGQLVVAARPAADPRRKVTSLAAVVLTLDDVLGQLPLTIYTKASWESKEFLFFLRAGGLRGGRYSATLGSLTLERVSVVPGVTVSGTIEGLLNPLSGAILAAKGRLTIRVQGRSAGTLELDRGRLAGTLDGHPVARRLVLDGRPLTP
jgi:hypothetical protein